MPDIELIKHRTKITDENLLELQHQGKWIELRNGLKAKIRLYQIHLNKAERAGDLQKMRRYLLMLGKTKEAHEKACNIVKELYA